MPEHNSFISNFTNWDANACFGLLPEVHEKISSVFGYTLNPSSIHSGGQSGKALIEEARENILTLLGNPKDTRLIFTSGATESNNTIVYTALWQALERGFKFSDREIVISAYEHPSILEPAISLKNYGFNLKTLNYQELNKIEQYLSDKTALLSIMLANNETGHLTNLPQNLKNNFPRVFLHSDAVQVLGKINFNFEQSGLDAITISAHKIGGLAGVGAILVKDRTIYSPLLLGGSQELRNRAGTENIIGIVSFGEAAKIAIKVLADRTSNMLNTKNIIINKIKSEVPNAKVLFEDSDTLPNTISVHFPNIFADDLVVALDLEKIFVSSGSACASGKPLASHVLLAHGFSEKEAKEVLRISVTGLENEEKTLSTCDKLINSVNRMYQQAN